MFIGISIFKFSMKKPIILVGTFLFIIKAQFLFGQNFTIGDNNARLYGIHEIALTGTDLPTASVRYSKFPIVRFANGKTSLDVKAFYDGDGAGGDGALWKARLYVTKTGSWSWTITDNAELAIKGSKSGSFEASDTNFKLNGKLRKHKDNATRWATERNRDIAFLAFGDTQYTLMDKVWTSEPDSSKGGTGDWDEVMMNSVKMGTTLMRAGAFGGYSRWDGTTTVGPYKYPRPNWPFKDQSMTGNKKEYDLEQMLATDARLQYSINTFPGLYIELIISPKVKEWARFFDGTDGYLDDGRGLNNAEKINFWTYTVARFSAYPNVNFQIVYDIRFSKVEAPRYPQEMIDANYAFGKEWLSWLYDNDPFETMKCVGTGNDEYDPYDSIFYAGIGNCYIHDEAISDISGYHVESYYKNRIRNVPIFHGEDTYEVVDGWYKGKASQPNAGDPEYYYRRLFWTDLLSGGYSCYGGGYAAIIPYDRAFDEIAYNTGIEIVTAKLKGMNDLHYIKDFFIDSEIDIAKYKPADYKAINGPPVPSQIQIAYDSLDDKYIIYHPNATGGEINYEPNDFQDVGVATFETHTTCSTDKDSTPEVTLYLSNEVRYVVSWFDPSAGNYYNLPDVNGAGINYTFTAPIALKGKDVVLLLDGESPETGITIIAHRGGKLWAPENTLAAFKKCADNNMNWETDLNLTADGEIVLMHDKTLDRTTNAEIVFGSKNIPVNSKTLAQIKMLDAGSHFGSEYAGEKVPTLDEFLDFFMKNAPENSIISMDTKMDKLKPAPGPEVYQSIIDKIADRNLFDRVFIEVSKIEAINNTKTLNNGDKLKYAIWVSSDTILLNNAIASGYFSRIHASASIAFMAEDVHAGGIHHFSSHPVGNRAQWESVKKYNIDGISTDRPDVALYVKDADIPTCSIKYPVTGANFNEGATITIKVDVGDSDASITKVEFYRNGKLIGEDTTWPYTYSMSDVTEGNYELKARVFDNGLSKISQCKLTVIYTGPGK